jgi:hypothetical protein
VTVSAAVPTIGVEGLLSAADVVAVRLAGRSAALTMGQSNAKHRMLVRRNDIRAVPFDHRVAAAPATLRSPVHRLDYGRR